MIIVSGAYSLAFLPNDTNVLKTYAGIFCVLFITCYIIGGIVEIQRKNFFKSIEMQTSRWSNSEAQECQRILLK